MKSILYVNILGHEYPVEADAGEELYVNRLAQFVEERMKSVREGSGTIDSYKLAVLAAMDITDELFKLQDSRGLNSQQAEIKVDQLIQQITNEIQQNPS
jgi:cell division protein ZapA (FtsZ GTPase activity inhibitor)